MDWTTIEFRLKALRDMSSSAFHSPTEASLKTARHVLRALHDKNPEYPRPRIYPTPDGGLSLEWILHRSLMDVRLSADGSKIEGEVSAKDLTEAKRFDSEIALKADKSQALLDWLQVAYDVDMTVDMTT